MADFGLNNNFSPSLSDSLKDEDFGANQPVKKKDFFSPKLQLAFITILAAVSLIFAAGSWLNSLKVGFAVKGNSNGDFLNTNFSFTNSDIDKTLALQNQDTDLDGLTDYDELYVYKTSPYLSDSDSDGYSDAQEIKNNENPNCPVGQTCGLTAPAQETVQENALSAAEIRQMLLEKGMIKEENLAEIDDATLMDLYQQSLEEASESGQSNVSELNFQDLENITPEQLRNILKEQSDISPEELDKLSDEDILKAWQELLRENAANSAAQ